LPSANSKVEFPNHYENKNNENRIKFVATMQIKNEGQTVAKKQFYSKTTHNP